MDMLVVISGKEIACLEKKYSPARWEILLELRKYAATYEKENKRQHFYSKLAGVSFGSTQEYIKYLQTGQLLQIKREPDNPFDVNAIAVYNGNYPIGHLKKEVAAHLAPVIDSQQGTVMITVEAVTGGGDHLWGVNISVTLIMHGELTEIEKSAGVYQKTKMDGGGIYMEELYDDEENNEEMDDLAVE